MCSNQYINEYIFDWRGRLVLVLKTFTCTNLLLYSYFKSLELKKFFVFPSIINERCGQNSLTDKCYVHDCFQTLYICVYSQNYSWNWGCILLFYYWIILITISDRVKTLLINYHKIFRIILLILQFIKQNIFMHHESF